MALPGLRHPLLQANLHRAHRAVHRELVWRHSVPRAGEASNQQHSLSHPHISRSEAPTQLQLKFCLIQHASFATFTHCLGGHDVLTPLIYTLVHTSSQAWTKVLVLS